MAEPVDDHEVVEGLDAREVTHGLRGGHGRLCSDRAVAFVAAYGGEVQHRYCASHLWAGTERTLREARTAHLTISRAQEGRGCDWF